MHDLHNNLLFLLERMKIGIVEKLWANLHDKKEYFIHITNVKQTCNHRLYLQKMYRVTKCNQKVLLKPYIDMNAGLKISEKWFWKIFSQVDKQCSFWKCHWKCEKT